MRLTLRTLLAYLDNTLDSSDRQVLGEKVKNSTLATSLTERIRCAIANPSLVAPSSEATSPNEDANTIAEYIDSTLSPELTTDLERHCLESEPQLAEVAACHQILATAESGTLEEIPEELQLHINALLAATPDLDADPSLTVSGSRQADEALSSSTPLSADVGPSSNASSQADGVSPQPQPVPDLAATIVAATKVIREKQFTEKREENGPSSAAMAGLKSRRQLEELGPILSSRSPIRITPVLVGFALSVLFLFVLSQSLKPLLRWETVETAEHGSNASFDEVTQSQANPAVGSSHPNTPASQPKSTTLEPSPEPPGKTPAPASEPTGPALNSGPVSGEPGSPPDADALRQPSPSTLPPSASSDKSEIRQPPSVANRSAAPTPTNKTDMTPLTVGPKETVRPAPSDTAATDRASSNAAPEGTSPFEIATAPSSSVRNPRGTPIDPASILDRVQDSDRATVASPLPPLSIAPPRILGEVSADGGLLLTQEEESGQWLSLPVGSSLTAGQVVAVPPTFRAQLSLDRGVVATLIGPCAMRLNRVGSGANNDPQRLFFTIDFGRMLIAAEEQASQFSLATPATSGRCRLLAPGSMTAIAVEYQRAPGQDPLAPATSKCVTTILSVEKELDWQPSTFGDAAVTQAISLAAGQRWSVTSGIPASIDQVAPLPPWAAANDLISTPDEITTRNRLIEFVSNDKPLEFSLREAVGFRESDVGALAAMTLLSLGMPDAYFGPAGILSQPQQRDAWPKLVDALQAFFDRGPPSAAMVGAAAEQGNGGEAAGKVWGLLSGFSPQMLSQGADRLLIEMMDDPDILVRVLATEISTQITGLEIEYHPEYETTGRRSQGLKRWQASQRRGQIVWKDPVAATAGRPRW